MPFSCGGGPALHLHPALHVLPLLLQPPCGTAGRQEGKAGQPTWEGHWPCRSPALRCVWSGGFAPRPAWQVSSEGGNGAPVAGPEFPPRTALKCVIPLGSNMVQTLAGMVG